MATREKRAHAVAVKVKTLVLYCFLTMHHKDVLTRTVFLLRKLALKLHQHLTDIDGGSIYCVPNKSTPEISVTTSCLGIKKPRYLWLFMRPSYKKG